LHWPFVVLFVVVNIVIGSLGAWLGALHDWVYVEHPRQRLIEQLEAGGFYTFAIAFLTSCASLVVAEYLEDYKGSVGHKRSKVALCIIALLLAIFSAFFTSQTPSKAQTLSTPNSSSASCQGARCLEAPRAASQDTTSPQNEEAPLPRQHKVQICMVIASVVVGLFLFLVMQYSSQATQLELKRIDDDDNDDADALAKNASSLIGG